MVVADEKVPLFTAPDKTSAVLARVSWDVVTIKEMQPDEPFQHVTTRRRQGWLYRLRQAAQPDRLPALGIIAQRQVWRIVSFIAGD